MGGGDAKYKTQFLFVTVGSFFFLAGDKVIKAQNKKSNLVNGQLNAMS